MPDELNDPVDDIFGSDDDDFNPANPFAAVEDDNDDPEVEDPSEEEETEEEADDEPEAEEEDEQEYEYDPDAIDPYEYKGRVYTSLSELKKAYEHAQDRISSTSQSERTPLSEALGMSAAGWQGDWEALSPQDQSLLQGEFARDPGGLARRLAEDVTILGRPLTEFVFNEWAKQEPYKAMNWAMEQQKLVAEWEAAQNQQAPQTDPYVQSYIEQQQSAEAEAILQENIYGWTPEIAQEVAAFIELNGEALGLRDADVSTPEGMAQFVAMSYYHLQGLKADLAHAEQEEPSKAKKRANTPVKSSATPKATGEEDPILDEIFGAGEGSGFSFPKL